MSELNEMQRAAINGVLYSLASNITPAKNDRSDQRMEQEATDVVNGADVIRRIMGEASSPAESTPCGPVVDMEKAREGLVALLHVAHDVPGGSDLDMLRSALDATAGLLRPLGGIYIECASQIDHIARRF